MLVLVTHTFEKGFGICLAEELIADLDGGVWADLQEVGPQTLHLKQKHTPQTRQENASDSHSTD